MRSIVICSGLVLCLVLVLFSIPSAEGGQMERLAALALVLRSLGRGGRGGGGMPIPIPMHMGGFPGKAIPIPIHGMKPKKCKEKVKVIVIQGKQHGMNSFHGGNAFVEYPAQSFQSQMMGSHYDSKDLSKFLIGGSEPVFKVATIGGSSVGGSGGEHQSSSLDGSWASSQHFGGDQSQSGGMSTSGSSQSPRIVYINDYKGQATKMLYDKHLQDTQGTWDQEW